MDQHVVRSRVYRHRYIYSLEFQFVFEAIPAEKGGCIGNYPFLHFAVTIEVRDVPHAVIQVCCPKRDTPPIRKRIKINYTRRRSRDNPPRREKKKKILVFFFSSNPPPLFSVMFVCLLCFFSFFLSRKNLILRLTPICALASSICKELCGKVGTRIRLIQILKGKKDDIFIV